MAQRRVAIVRGRVNVRSKFQHYIRCNGSFVIQNIQTLVVNIISKMTSTDYSEHRTIIKFCVNLGKTPTQTREMLESAAIRPPVSRALILSGMIDLGMDEKALKMIRVVGESQRWIQRQFRLSRTLLTAGLAFYCARYM